MYECLRKVTPQLMLGDVELLRVQRRGPARGTVALEPPGGKDVVALLGVGERHPEPAEQEGALRLAQRTLVGAVAVAVSVLGELELDRLQGGEGAGIRLAIAPRMAGSSSAASTRASLGERCQRPDG